MKNETVTYDFINQSYASMIAEDWIGAFTWPDCNGYKNALTDHYCASVFFFKFQK